MDWIAKAFGILEILLVLAAIIFHKIKSGKGSNPRSQTSAFGKEASYASVESAEVRQYRFKDLEAATNNFSNENKLGSGGFGAVYKGMLDGQLVAIKKLYGNSVKLLADVAKEVSLLSSLRNDNIVQLLGFCFEPERYLLVYEYIPNKDLHYWLTDETKCQTLDWKLRLNIIKGLANGLFYLHHGSDNTIVHRDLKPANVMLDEHHNAKIADFGLSRDFDLNKTHRTTKKAAGTYGYIAPELFFRQQYSTKSDVYSYGQLVLEILVGCTIYQFAKANEQTLSHVVWKQWKDNRPLTEVIDASIQCNYPQDQVIRCILIGLLCVQHNQEERPNMEIVKDLLNNNHSLPAPSFPGFFQGHGIDRGPTFEDSTIKTYSLQDLKIATNNFSCKLWDDSRYVAYKGSLDGRPVAVEEYSGFAYGDASNLVRVSGKKKMLTFFSEENKNIKRDFLLPRMRHPNVVKILGYSLEVEAKLFLIFQYPKHGRLADHLNKRPSNVAALDWPKRRKIALGTARCLSYLHNECNPKVIHRNVRAANIFLDHNFEAVVGYFGHVKLIDDKDTKAATAVQGITIPTAPEYLSTGKSSEKSDVFRYGIMLLKLISGQRAFDLARHANYDDAMLIEWIKVLLKEQQLERIVDPDLQNNFTEIEVESLIKVALLCSRASPLQRPRMSEVVRMLEGGNTIEMCEDWHNVLLRGGFMFIYDDEDPEIHIGQLKQFSLKELQMTTCNFSNENLIGRGGFGKVYKGSLVDGTLVAVKRMNYIPGNPGGEVQFQYEQKMSSMTVHRNLLRLRGFCVARKERLLVYPYMAHGSVVSLLRERPLNLPPLDWSQRKNIALGAARGLSYLHHHCEYKVIHRDIKAANILLDEDFEAVVADFALAILMNYNDTHVTTAVRGTIGHISPEYMSTGKVSEKTDMFAYGIMLLELITGQQAFDLARLANDDGVKLLDWVKLLLREKMLHKLVDPELGNNFDENEVGSLTKLALMCTQASPLVRPTMSEVVWMLEAGGETIEFPIMLEGEWLTLPERREDMILGDNLTAIELSRPSIEIDANVLASTESDPWRNARTRQYWNTNDPLYPPGKQSENTPPVTSKATSNPSTSQTKQPPTSQKTLSQIPKLTPPPIEQPNLQNWNAWVANRESKKGKRVTSPKLITEGEISVAVEETTIEPPNTERATVLFDNKLQGKKKIARIHTKNVTKWKINTVSGNWKEELKKKLQTWMQGADAVKDAEPMQHVSLLQNASIMEWSVSEESMCF